MLRGHSSLQRLLGKPGPGRKRPREETRKGKSNKATVNRGIPKDSVGADTESENIHRKVKEERDLDSSLIKTESEADFCIEDDVLLSETNFETTKSPKRSKGDVQPSEQDFQHLVVDFDDPFHFKLSTHIKGTRFYPLIVSTGDFVGFKREFGNKRDARAVHVVSENGDVVGYLPAVVSWVLADHMDNGKVVLNGWVVQILDKEIRIEVDGALHGGDTHSNDEALSLLRTIDASLSDPSIPNLRIPMGECLRENFQTITNFVQDNDNHLLDANDTAFLDAYDRISQPAQCLFLRLMLRKGPWFRANSLSYSEVPDMEGAINELVNGKLLVSHEELDCNDALDALLGTMTVDDLKMMAGKLDVKVQGHLKRVILDQVKEAAKKLAKQGKPALATVTSITGLIVRMTDQSTTTIQRLQRVYFLSESLSLSTFTAVEAGVIKWPHYKVSITKPAFPNRQSLLEYEKSLHNAAKLDTALEQDNLPHAEIALKVAWTSIEQGDHKKVDWVCGNNDDNDSGGDVLCKPPNPVLGLERAQCCVPLFLARFNAAWVYVEMATIGVSLLEKQKRYKEAAEKLRILLGGNCCPSRRGYWWNRLATNLEHMNHHQEALEVSESALADDWVRHGDKFSIQRKVLRLGKPPRRWKRPKWASTVMQNPHEVQVFATPLEGTIGKNRFVGIDGQNVCVEELALQYYALKGWGGWKGCHSENGVWHTLFGLLMWDVLFSDVGDVFRCPFQSAPLDLFTDAFAPTRKSAIDNLLQKVRHGEFKSIVRSTWNDHYGTVCHGVNWTRHSLPEIMEIGECIGGQGLAAVCEMLAQDYKGLSGGLPDLLLWDPDKKKAKLCEVKGPRDRLSDQQRAWIQSLTSVGVEVEVFKVVDKQNGKTTVQKGRR